MRRRQPLIHRRMNQRRARPFALPASSGWTKVSIYGVLLIVAIFSQYFRAPLSQQEQGLPSWKGRTDTEPAKRISSSAAKSVERIAGNVHGLFPRVCGAPVNPSTLHPGTGPLYEKMEELNAGGDAHLHIIQDGLLDEKLDKLIKLQVCMYSSLDRWTQLAKKHNLRWAAIAGSVVGVKCYQSINPWDDDIDIMVVDCDAVEAIYASATTIPSLSHVNGDWTYNATYLDEDWILSKFSSEVKKQHWYKLKPKAQLTVVPTVDTSGMDILCVLQDSPTESDPMRNSGYTEYLQSDRPLESVTFGPTKIQMVPPDISDLYIWKRFNNSDPCNLHGLYGGKATDLGHLKE